MPLGKKKKAAEIAEDEEKSSEEVVAEDEVVLTKKEKKQQAAKAKKEAAAKKKKKKKADSSEEEEEEEEGGGDEEETDKAKKGATKTPETKKKKKSILSLGKKKKKELDVEKGETTVLFKDTFGTAYSGVEVLKDTKLGGMLGLTAKLKGKAAGAAANAAMKASKKKIGGLDLSVDIKIPNRFIARGWTPDKKKSNLFHQMGTQGFALLVIEEKTSISLNCMNKIIEPGQTYNIKKTTGEGPRDVAKKVLATIKKNPTYCPALASTMYCLKQPTEVWDASGSRTGAFMYPADPMVDTCFGGLTQTKSLIMHVKDGNGALKYRVVQDSSTGCLEKIFPCLGGGETVYGIHPVRPGATGAGLCNGDRILPAVGSYAEVFPTKNCWGCWNDPGAVRLKLPDDIDDGERLLLMTLLVDHLGDPGDRDK